MGEGTVTEDEMEEAKVLADRDIVQHLPQDHVVKIILWTHRMIKDDGSRSRCDDKSLYDQRALVAFVHHESNMDLYHCWWEWAPALGKWVRE